jgi:hypothetical protein
MGVENKGGTEYIIEAPPPSPISSLFVCDTKGRADDKKN